MKTFLAVARREIAARERHIPQLRRAPISVEVGDHCLRPPHVTVVAESRTVERQPDHRCGDPMLSRHGGDVGVVVLHRDGSRQPQLLGHVG